MKGERYLFLRLGRLTILATAMPRDFAKQCDLWIKTGFRLSGMDSKQRSPSPLTALRN